MSIKVMARVWEKNLEHNELLVLLAMADHARDDGTKVFPSIGHIAWKVGYSERQVKRILSTLREKKVLILVAKPNNGRHPNEYRIDLDPLPEKESWRGDILSPVTQLSHARGDTAMAYESLGEPPVTSISNEIEGDGAPQLIKKLAEQLDDADVPLMKRQKTIYGKQFKEALKKGVPYAVLEKAAERIVDRWQSAKHAKLSVDMALTDVTNGKAEKVKRGSPEKAIDSIRGSELSRYATVMEHYDFSQPNLNAEAVPINVLKQLGGDFTEQSRNLARIMSVSRRSKR